MKRQLGVSNTECTTNKRAKTWDKIRSEESQSKPSHDELVKEVLSSPRCRDQINAFNTLLELFPDTRDSRNLPEIFYYNIGRSLTCRNQEGIAHEWLSQYLELYPRGDYAILAQIYLGRCANKVELPFTKAKKFSLAEDMLRKKIPSDQIASLGAHKPITYAQRIKWKRVKYFSNIIELADKTEYLKAFVEQNHSSRRDILMRALVEVDGRLASQISEIIYSPFKKLTLVDGDAYM